MYINNVLCALTKNNHNTFFQVWKNYFYKLLKPRERKYVKKTWTYLNYISKHYGKRLNKFFYILLHNSSATLLTVTKLQASTLSFIMCLNIICVRSSSENVDIWVISVYS